jgi:hypothetical protein
MDVLVSLHHFLFITIIVLAVPFFLGLCAYLSSIVDDGVDDETLEVHMCVRKIFFILSAIISVSVVLIIAIPSQDTMYKMLAANYLTPANIESVGESVDKIADKVVEKINNIQK